jgi:hypothetical protein
MASQTIALIWALASDRLVSWLFYLSAGLFTYHIKEIRAQIVPFSARLRFLIVHAQMRNATQARRERMSKANSVIKRDLLW